MPAWVVEQLVDKGHLTAQGLTRKAKVVTHWPCRQATIAGLDSDSCALDAWCDIAQLAPRGELGALLDGRLTYWLHGDRLDRRDRWSIPGSLPSHDLTVLAEHRCGAPVPPGWRLPPPPARPKPVIRPEEAPF